MRWQAVVLAGCAASLAGCELVRDTYDRPPARAVRYEPVRYRTVEAPAAVPNYAQHLQSLTREPTPAREPVPTLTDVDATGLAAPTRPLVKGPPPWAAPPAEPPAVVPRVEPPTVSVPVPVPDAAPMTTKPLPDGGIVKPLPERIERVKPLPDRAAPVKPLGE